jgi:hypothetical protein
MLQVQGKVSVAAAAPYLSERQWETVREDYGEGGNAWDYFSHDQARSCAYRWVSMVWPAFPTTNNAWY